MPHGTTIAFHSYKGGTGKTTLISNLAALYAARGSKVCLLDFDVYAPSLMSYFKKNPRAYLNDLLNGEADMSRVVVDVSGELELKGTLLLGFSSNKKEDVNAIEIRHELKWQLAAMRRFLSAKSQLFEQFGIEYLFLDTSPGIRYWSINALAAADNLFLIMKDSDMDVDGTKRMISDIYDSLAKFGSRFFVILNKVPGASPATENRWRTESGISDEHMDKEIESRVIGSIPCFCDVQFSRHEFLWAVKQPEHPFSKKLITVAETVKNL